MLPGNSEETEEEKKVQLRHQTGNQENWVPFKSLIDLFCDLSITSLYHHFLGYGYGGPAALWHGFSLIKCLCIAFRNGLNYQIRK